MGYKHAAVATKTYDETRANRGKSHFQFNMAIYLDEPVPLVLISSAFPYFAIKLP